MTPVIEARQIVKQFGATRALAGVDLLVPRGRVIPVPQVLRQAVSRDGGSLGDREPDHERTPAGAADGHLLPPASRSSSGPSTPTRRGGCR